MFKQLVFIYLESLYFYFFYFESNKFFICNSLLIKVSNSSTHQDNNSNNGYKVRVFSNKREKRRINKAKKDSNTHQVNKTKD